MGSTCSCQVAMLHGMYMCNIAVHGNQGWPGLGQLLMAACSMKREGERK